MQITNVLHWLGTSHSPTRKAGWVELEKTVTALFMPEPICNVQKRKLADEARANLFCVIKHMRGVCILLADHLQLITAARMKYTFNIFHN